MPVTLSSVPPVPLSSLGVIKKDTVKRSDDGRLRTVFFRVGVFDDRKGSSYVEIGSTKVSCSIDGPKQLKKMYETEFLKGLLQVTVQGGKNDFPKVIKSSLHSLICLELFSKAQIDVQLTILEDDGATLAASLIAASLALCNAGIQTFDLCVAAHVAIVDEKVIVDPCLSEIPENSCSITVAMMPSLNQLICCEVSGIASVNSTLAAIETATKCSQKLYPYLRKCLEGRNV